MARYTATNDTGGVGVPYLRVFLEPNPADPDNDPDRAIFSPNTQAPDPDMAEGPFHTWVATSGSWRYDDDPGNGPDMPFADLIPGPRRRNHSGIFVTTGFTAGPDLNALMLSFEVNGQEFDFGG